MPTNTSGMDWPITAHLNSCPLHSRYGRPMDRFGPVIDYRKLNESTLPNTYPMITTDDILKATAGKAIFSKCDSANGYDQIPLRDLKDGKYSAYSLP